METKGRIAYDIRDGEKFIILVIEEHKANRQVRKLSVYRRNEYGEWPQAVIDTICGAFDKIYAESEKRGMSKALAFAIDGRHDAVAVLFSCGNETRDPYKGRPIYYNERPANSVPAKDLYSPASESDRDTFSVYSQRSEDGKREILVLNKILNPNDPINDWKTRSITIARDVKTGIWNERRVEQIVKRFDELYEMYKEDGDRIPMFFTDPDNHRRWKLSFVTLAETSNGLIHALLHEPAD